MENLFITNQIQIENKIVLSSNMPDIERIDEILTDFNINKKYIIKTPVGESVEGLKSNGQKLIINWTLKQKIVYIAADNQNLHVEKYNCDYINYITLPLTAFFLPDAISELLSVKIALEDINFYNADKRTVCEKLTVTLSADKEIYEYYFNSYNLGKLNSFDLNVSFEQEEDD